MDLPPLEGPPVVDWKGTAETTETTRLAQAQTEARSVTEAVQDALCEKIIGDKNNLRGIAFLERGIQVARAVALVVLPEMGTATGFLIEDDVLMTNNHVFQKASDAKGAVVKFNYQKDLEGKDLPTTDYECDPDDLFWTSPQGELDCSIVRVKGNPGAEWGKIPLPSSTRLNPGDEVVIIQHPAGRQKEIALADNEVAYVDDRLAQYLTDTEPGSSGSPVFDSNWRLVALHHSGGWVPEPSTRSTHYRNEGIVISAIRDAMPS